MKFITYHGIHAPTPHPSEEPFLQALGFDSCSLDVLMSRLDIDVATMQIKLLNLELEGLIERLPGGMYQRISRQFRAF